MATVPRGTAVPHEDLIKHPIKKILSDNVNNINKLKYKI
jgi:hypothetical protein